ncbi:MAG: hypothetical protein HKO66_11780 [Saprospiraceae bacterium]|nr:hypothetical protein [Bacteroidia bacterium]NNE15837.1 hypothetical protein [Saprospiraceae bacterium]NNL92908.1 hypothetical protein [Saprospiraceae bacterium]
MKIVFKRWLPEDLIEDIKSYQPNSDDNLFFKAIIETLNTIDKDLDNHIKKENENDENI